MNICLWILQGLAALLYGASGVMKIFMFDKISADVPSFAALPRQVWRVLGLLELVCVLGLIVPAALHWQPLLTVVAAAVLALESLVFIGVHVKYREVGTIVMSGVLGLLMAFVAYGRLVLQPLAIIGIVVIASTLWAPVALAETPYERDQREQLEKYQREHGLSPQVQQAQRWEREWKEQHPGQPVPNAGALQKLHRSETQANINAGFTKMRADRQAQLQHEYQLSRDRQAQINASQHITWTPQQWKVWDRQYDEAQHQKAIDYQKAAAMAGEIDRRQREQEEQDKYLKGNR